MRVDLKFFNNLESWYKYRYLCRNERCRAVTYTRYKYQQKRLIVKAINQHLFALTQSKHLIQDTFNYVRENVRLYNCCGLVSTVYFVSILLGEKTT